MQTHTDTKLLEANGYKPLTLEYMLPEEEELLERAKAQLDKNSIAYALVENELGVAIWRKERWHLSPPTRTESQEGGAL